MVIKVNEIKKLFSQLFNKLISRESAQQIAIGIRDNYDNGNIEFYPLECENQIWDAVQFIELFAEKIDESTYLYSESDLMHYLQENGWDINT